MVSAFEVGAEPRASPPDSRGGTAAPWTMQSVPYRAMVLVLHLELLPTASDSKPRLASKMQGPMPLRLRFERFAIRSAKRRDSAH